MKIERIQQYFNQMEMYKLNREHDILLMEKRAVVNRLEDIEQTRLRRNRELKLDGQNVDKLA